jgi:hypothetical protein
MTDFTGAPHDFDFFSGRFSLVNRRLRQRHVGSDDWEEFPGLCTAWTMMDGMISTDELRFPTKDFIGSTFRTFHRGTRHWSIYWVNSRDGILQPPVHGGFRDGRGEFYGEDVDEGRPILVRYIWSRDSAAPRWEQAFSLDRGRTWEDNWSMDFTKVA